MLESFSSAVALEPLDLCPGSGGRLFDIEDETVKGLDTKGSDGGLRHDRAIDRILLCAGD